MSAIYRELTTGEVFSFNLRHPSLILNSIPSEGQYISDSYLGVVLVFKKADGDVMYIQTSLPSDPSANDPGYWSYVLGQFWDSLKKNTGDVFKTTGIGVSAALIIAVIVLGIIYLPQRFSK